MCHSLEVKPPVVRQPLPGAAKPFLTSSKRAPATGSDDDCVVRVSDLCFHESLKKWSKTRPQRLRKQFYNRELLTSYLCTWLISLMLLPWRTVSKEGLSRCAVEGCTFKLSLQRTGVSVGWARPGCRPRKSEEALHLPNRMHPDE